jgi:hypothetical protein
LLEIYHHGQDNLKDVRYDLGLYIPLFLEGQVRLKIMAINGVHESGYDNLPLFSMMYRMFL